MRPLALALLPGCIFGIQGSGVAETESLALDTFDVVRQTTLLDVQITAGDTPSGELTCDDNLLSYFWIDVRNGELEIRTEPGVNLRPRVRCELDVVATDLVAIHSSGSGDLRVEDAWPRLEEVSSSGSGDVDVADAGGEDLDVGLSGSGNLTLAGIDAGLVEIGLTGSGNLGLDGASELLDVGLSGSGDVDGDTFVTVDAEVSLTGSGNTTFDATGSVTGRMSGSGDLIVGGDPDIDVRNTGSGRIRRR